MKDLSKFLLLIEEELVRLKFPNIDILQIGLSRDKVKELLDGLNLVSDLLVALYGWRNGVPNMNEQTIGKVELFARAIMLPLQDAIKHYNYAASNEIWDLNLFPIFTNGGGDYLLFDTDKQDGMGGQILIYAPSILPSEQPVSIYDDITTMFETVLACYKQGAYQFDQDGFIEVDYQIEQQLAQSKNPNSKYWSLDS
jgi:hypothetical protein